MTNSYSKIDKQLAEGRADTELRARALLSQGTQSVLPAFYRFVVLESIFDPSVIDKNKILYFEHTLGVSNIQFASVLPRNTIIAKRVIDSTTPASAPAMFLFPFFPPAISFPCQPGEHVWVMFENQAGTKNDLGYWMCRIVEPGFVEDANHTHAPRAFDPGFHPNSKEAFDGTNPTKYEFRNGRADIRDGERYTIAESATLHGDEDVYERLGRDTDGAKASIKEPVPRYKKRPGDVSLEGSNNSLIVLGRDRTGAAATFTVDERTKVRSVSGIPESDTQTAGAGMIDLVVGRGQTTITGGTEVESFSVKGQKTGYKEVGKASSEVSEAEGDPDFSTDKSRILIAQKTRVDSNFGLAVFNIELGAGSMQGGPANTDKKNVQDSATGDAAIVIKSDKLRLIARSDVEILVTGYTERDNKGNIVASTNDADHAVIAIKANGDIVFRPAAHGYIKLGGDNADKALMCSDLPATVKDGVVTGSPIVDTMGGQQCGSKAGPPNDNVTALASGQGKFAAKILVR